MDALLDALLHPVRYQVVQHLAKGELTPKQLHARMPTVAPATLYRHLAALADVGLVVVTSEEQVRGAVERTYALGPVLAKPHPDPDQRLAQAMLMLALLQSDVESALRAAPAGEPPAGLTLTRTVLHLTDDDRQHLQRQLVDLVTPLLEKRPGTRPHTLGLIMTPQALDGPHEE